MTANDTPSSDARRLKLMLGGMRFSPSGLNSPRASTEMLKIHRIGNSTVNVIARRISCSASCLGHGSFFSSVRRPAPARWPKRKYAVKSRPRRTFARSVIGGSSLARRRSFGVALGRLGQAVGDQGDDQKQEEQVHAEGGSN